MLVPATILTGGQSYACDPALRARLGPSAPVTLFGGSAILGEVAAKRRLHAETGAVAVDLESGAVAAVAARHGLPFAALRVICDPAGRALPPAALIALDRQGRIGPLRILTSLLRRPGQVADLLRLAGDAKMAQDALRGRVRQIGA